MTDYIAAFKRGLASAEEAKRNKEDIESVIKEVHDQIKEETNGKILITRRNYRSYKGVAPVMAVFRTGIPEETWIVAEQTSLEDSPRCKLAKISLSPTGYPCEIELNGDSHTCVDRESLSRMLSQVLSDPEVGESLQGLLKLP